MQLNKFYKSKNEKTDKNLLLTSLRKKVLIVSEFLSVVLFLKLNIQLSSRYSD